MFSANTGDRKTRISKENRPLLPSSLKLIALSPCQKVQFLEMQKLCVTESRRRSKITMSRCGRTAQPSTIQLFAILSCAGREAAKNPEPK